MYATVKNIISPKKRPFYTTLILSAFVWALVFIYWFTLNPNFEIAPRVPYMDGSPVGINSSNINANGLFGDTFFDLIDSASVFDAESQKNWNRFRGKNHDNINTENIPLTDLSNNRIPPLLWSVDLGEGHAAPAVHRGRVYIIDYDEEREADVLRCFSLDSGREIWQRGYSVRVRRNHGMSRTVPAVSDDAVVTVGPMCHVMAAHPASGDFLWGIDLAGNYGTTVPLWYTGQCPLIDDTVAVIAPAGARALLIGVDVRTGEVLWETPNLRGWQMSHSSVVPMEFFGRKVYVYAASGGIAGVSAAGEDRGGIVFETDEFNHSVIAPSPVAIGGNRIFMTAGYGAGGAVFRVDESGGGLSITLVQRYEVREGLASEQQTPVYHGGFLYAVLPKDAGAHREQFAIVGGGDPSAILWSSGVDYTFGLGPFLIADSKFFILADNGVLTAAALSSRGFAPLGSAQILHGVDAWGPLALAGGKLLARDSRRLVCVDLRKNP